MRYILFSILLIITSSCHGQQNNDQQVYVNIDSLFDADKSQKTDYDLKQVMKNCLVMQDNSVAVFIIQSESVAVKSLSELPGIFKKQKGIISKSTFYFFFDKSDSFRIVNQIIDYIEQQQIKDYKIDQIENLTKQAALENLLKITKPFKPSLAAPIVIPQSVQIKSKSIDSSYFVVNGLENNYYYISFLNKNTTIKGKTALDKFIQRRIALIKNGKIVIESYENTKYEAMKPVFDILKKYKYYKFQLLTIPPSEK